MSSQRTEFRTVNFALVVCRNPLTGKWLAVDESRDRGWWLPGGAVDAGETFPIAARRECQEEAGVRVVLRGIICQDYALMGKDVAKMRVIYYAEPTDPSPAGCRPKQEPDAESNGARWVTLDEFRAFKKIRGAELLEYAGHVEAGGHIFPMSMMEVYPDGDANPEVFKDSGDSAARRRAFQVVAPAAAASTAADRDSGGGATMGASCTVPATTSAAGAAAPGS